MAGENFGPIRGHKAGADLSAATHRAVKKQADGSIIRGTLGARCVGILMNDPKAGQPGAVQVAEGGKWVAGAAFDAGVPLTTDAEGRAIEATTAGHHVLAYANEPSTGVGHVVSVEIVHAGKI